MVENLSFSDSSRISYTKFYIYKLGYNFDTVLYQFLGTGTSDITHIGLNQLMIYSPFHTEEGGR